MNKSTRHPDGNFYGRRLGRPLTPARQAALDTVMPVCAIPAERVTCDGTLSPASLFEKTYAQYWLEIGFGTGEHLLPLLARHPDTAYIGVEPFINGMAALCKNLCAPHPAHPEEHGNEGPKASQSDSSATPKNDAIPKNIRLWMDDAVVLAQSLSDNSLDGIYILNPDPWHKARHHKRRIVRPETLDIYARILKPGGQLVMSTDVPYLAEWMVTHASNHPAFEWTAETAQDWKIPPAGWVHTAYETKRAKGADRMVYLLFIRK